MRCNGIFEIESAELPGIEWVRRFSRSSCSDGLDDGASSYGE